MTLNPVMLLAGIALLGGGAVLKLGSNGTTSSGRSGGFSGRVSAPRLALEDVPALGSWGRHPAQPGVPCRAGRPETRYEH